MIEHRLQSAHDCACIKSAPKRLEPGQERKAELEVAPARAKEAGILSTACKLTWTLELCITSHV